jgi:hypothetical protein
LGRRKTFVYPVIDDKPLWPDRVPGGEQCDGEHGKGEFPFVHFHISLEIRILDLRRSMSVVEYAALVIVVMRLCAVATDAPVSPQKSSVPASND